MGIQQGINTMLGTAGIAAAAGKHLKQEHDQNVLHALGLKNEFTNQISEIGIKQDTEALNYVEDGGPTTKVPLTSEGQMMWDKAMSSTHDEQLMRDLQKDIFNARMKNLQNLKEQAVEKNDIVNKMYKKDFKNLDKVKGGIK